MDPPPSHFQNMNLGPPGMSEGVQPPPPYPMYAMPSGHPPSYGQPVFIDVQASPFPQSPPTIIHQPTVIAPGQPCCHSPVPFRRRRLLCIPLFLCIPFFFFLIVFFIIFGATGGFSH